MSGAQFHQRLRAAMSERRLSVPALAEAAPFSERTLARWRAGQSVPGAEALPLLSHALDVPIGWLVGEGPDSVPQSKDSLL